MGLSPYYINGENDISVSWDDLEYIVAALRDGSSVGHPNVLYQLHASVADLQIREG